MSTGLWFQCFAAGPASSWNRGERERKREREVSKISAGASQPQAHGPEICGILIPFWKRCSADLKELLWRGQKEMSDTRHILRWAIPLTICDDVIFKSLKSTESQPQIYHFFLYCVHSDAWVFWKTFVLKRDEKRLQSTKPSIEGIIQ